VEVDRGGSALIRVSDDGCGMSREDALLSLERHATSKLRTAGDLAAIMTLGFRGEAVPSIASVSRFRLVTREHEAVAGTEISVDGGKVRDVREAGCAPGTVIEAKALFFNMPARRKFLRAESTEAAHVEHQLRLHALAAPGVRFRLRRDDREIFDLAPAAKAVDRVRQILGTELSRELIELPLTHGNGMTVHGYVLPASHARKGRRHQYVFLNGRPVEDGVISRALAEGFRGAVADGMHPAAWLWIELEPHLVDVNVHPAKREVRFHKPTDVRDGILEAVARGVRPRVETIVAPKLAEPLAVEPLARMRFHAQEPLLEGLERPREAVAEPVKVVIPVMPEFRVMGLLHHRYILMESEDGLVMFDPKAAWDRIFYEKLKYREGDVLETQSLLVPLLLELDARELDLVLRERMALMEAGIEVEAFGGNTLQVRSFPACLTVAEPRLFLGALIDELVHDPVPGPRFALDRMARVLAKRAAASVIPRLSDVPNLLIELFSCELPYCAADGRPTLTEFSLRELGRRFGVNSQS
jgi:DNA mismatch repair protein MutL